MPPVSYEALASHVTTTNSVVPVPNTSCSTLIVNSAHVTNDKPDGVCFNIRVPVLLTGNVKKIDGPLGDMPINPALQTAWQQVNLQPPSDFGDPNAQGQPGEGGEVPGDPGQVPGASPDFGTPEGDEPAGNDFGQPDDGAPPAEGGPMGKSFGLPVFKLEP